MSLSVKRLVRSKYILSFLAVICILILSGCIDNITIESITTSHTNDTTSFSSDTISIACWNLQIFGKTKAANDTLLHFYQQTLENYDIFIIQEIRDSSGTAITRFANRYPNHTYIISERAGQSSSKEQYAIFYKDSIQILSTHDHTSQYQQVMQRPPIEVCFQINNWTFTLFTIHTQPDNVAGELSVLQKIVGETSMDTIIIGDLNADGSYYDEDDIEHFTNWSWVVTNNMDTTVATSDNTYDRIILNDDAINNFISVGIMDTVTFDISDHYLVYAIFDSSIP